MRLFLTFLTLWLIGGFVVTQLQPFQGSIRERFAQVVANFGTEFGELNLAERPTPAELRSQLLEHGDKLRGLREQPADQRTETYADEVREATRAIQSLDAELTATERAQFDELRSRLGSAGPLAAFGDLTDVDFRTAGEQFVEGDAYTNRGDNRRHVGETEVRTLLSSETSDPAAGLWRPVGTPLPPNVRQQRLFVRDVISVVQTTLASVPYLRELNAATNAVSATAVAEGSAKPEVTMQFEQDDAPIRKIAAWLPVTEEVIEDAPTLRGYIDTRLGYMLALREEHQILNGPGTGPNIKGIREFDIQTQASVGSGEYFATIGRAIGLVEAVDLVADFVASNPGDYWTALTTRHANQFDGGQGGGIPYGSPPTGAWGLPVIRTAAMESTKSLVGAGRLGATLFDRQRTTIRTLDQHSDYAIYNKLVVLAEERVGLAVHREDAFVEATIS